MSATVHTRADRDEAVYARLFREGRAGVLARMERDFPDVSSHDREDSASLALLDMIRARRLSRWEPGAVGLWGEMARQRMVNGFVRDRRRAQHARLEPLTEETEAVAASSTPYEEIEAALSDWRAVELMAQLSPRAATFVRLRVLEGGSRADVMAATGWSGKQYEKAQSAAKTALRASLGDLDSPRRCGQYRRLIDRRALGVELSERKQAELRAHLERCGSCRAYGSEAHRALHSVAPLLGLIPASAAGGALVAGAGSAGIGVSAGALSKGAAILCAGALCAGGAYVLLHNDGKAPPRREAAASKALVTGSPPPSAAPRQAVAKPTRRRVHERARGRDDALGLGSSLPQRPARPAPDPSPAPVPLAAGDAESAFGLGAATRSAPAPRAACAPGELGC